MTCIIEHCGKPVENRDTGLCSTHNREQRKAEERASRVKIVHAINKVSAKRKAENLVYSKRRKHYLEEHPNCELKLDGCTKKATQIHHSKGRLGSNFTNKKTFKATCFSCHKQLHDKMSAKEAQARGYSVSRLVV